MSIIASLLVGMPYSGPLVAPFFLTLCRACGQKLLSGTPRSASVISAVSPSLTNWGVQAIATLETSGTDPPRQETVSFCRRSV